MHETLTIDAVGTGATPGMPSVEATANMAWIPGGELPDGLRPALSGGAPGPPGHGRRVLDRPDSGHQRGVRPVRRGHRLRHVRRDASQSRRLSRRLAGDALRRLAGLREAGAARWIAATSPTGGTTCAAPTGAIRRARRARSRASSSIRSSTSPSATPRRTPRGRGRSCRPRRSGSSPRAAGSRAPTYAWGDEFMPGGRIMANTWQGEFPWQNRVEDGYEGTSPVGRIPGERLRPARHDRQRLGVDDGLVRAAAIRGGPPGRCCGPRTTRAGAPRSRATTRRSRTIRIPRKVIKGGSHLCAPNYCRRYRPAARFPEPVDTSTCHVGFRCIIRPAADRAPSDAPARSPSMRVPGAPFQSPSSAATSGPGRRPWSTVAVGLRRGRSRRRDQRFREHVRSTTALIGGTDALSAADGCACCTRAWPIWCWLWPGS